MAVQIPKVLTTPPSSTMAPTPKSSATSTSRMSRRRSKGVNSILNEDIGFDMQRLFDHYNFDHIPEGLTIMFNIS